MIFTSVKIFITISIVFACSYVSTDGLRILGLFPLAGKNHFFMGERLAKHLAQQGHELDVYSHFPQERPIANYTDHSLAGTIPILVNNISYDYLKDVKILTSQFSIKYVGQPICELLGTPVFQKLFEKLKKIQPYDVVIVEVFSSSCFLAWRRYLNIPMVGVMTSSLIDFYNEPLGNPVNTAITPGCWSGLLHPMDFWQRLTNTIIYYQNVLEYHYYIKSQNKYIEQFFGSGYPDAADLPKDIDLLLVNMHDSFDGIRALTPAIVPVGGLHIVDDGSKLPDKVQKWLDESRDGCIYFSFGSMVRIETFPKSMLLSFYQAFINIAPVRVLFRIVKPEELPPGLPSNVMTESWFPQIHVLKHKNIKAFVTHGGLSSTQESIYAGVPMISVPLFGDQHLNVKLQTSKKIAIYIDFKEITEQSFTAAMNEVLNNPVYKRNAESFSKKFFDRPMSPIDTATFWIEYIARHGKNALRSPLVDMPWWQVNLIDVYGFVLLVLVLTSYVLIVITKKLFNFFSSSQNPNKSNKRTKKDQ